MKYLYFLLAASLMQLPAFSQTATKTALPQLGKGPVRDVVAAMTLEEKAKQSPLPTAQGQPAIGTQ